MAAKLGYKLVPSDVDLVQALELSVAGQKPEWLTECNVFSKHPDLLFGTVKPASDVKQLHTLFGVKMYPNQREKPIPGGGYYLQSGPQEPITNSNSFDVGFYKVYLLYVNGHSTPWTLKEYYSLAEGLKDCKFAVYTACYRNDLYLKGEKLFTKAVSSFNLSTPVKQQLTITPGTPLIRRSFVREESPESSGETFVYSGPVETRTPTVLTRSQTKAKILEDLIKNANHQLASSGREIIEETVVNAVPVRSLHGDLDEMDFADISDSDEEVHSVLPLTIVHPGSEFGIDVGRTGVLSDGASGNISGNLSDVKHGSRGGSGELGTVVVSGSREKEDGASGELGTVVVSGSREKEDGASGELGTVVVSEGKKGGVNIVSECDQVDGVSANLSSGKDSKLDVQRNGGPSVVLLVFGAVCVWVLGVLTSFMFSK